MGAALGAADEVVLLDVWLPAREAADPEVTGRLVADAVPLPPDAVHYVPDLEDVASVLAERARPGDLVLTLGAQHHPGRARGAGPAGDAGRRWLSDVPVRDAPAAVASTRRSGCGAGSPAVSGPAGC